MATYKERPGKRSSLPHELSKVVQMPMHPEIHKELKIIALRQNCDTSAAWLHQHLCTVLGREDLSLRSNTLASSR